MLDEWAREYGVSAEALLALRVRMGIAATEVMPSIELDDKTGSEGYQQSLVRIEAAQRGVFLTRNNVGALLDERGVPVRYGLFNESKEQNKLVKSSDLIGWESILIGPQHVGTVIARFTSIEMKKRVWQFNPKDDYEVGQLNWNNFVNSKGGFAQFCTGPESFLKR